MWEEGKTTGSSPAIINLGSDTGLRGLTSTAPHNWVTHRGRPTQAIMWWGVGRGLGEVGEGGSHTEVSSFALKPRSHRSRCGDWLRFRQWERERERASTRQSVDTPSLWCSRFGEACLHVKVSAATSTRQHPQVGDGSRSKFHKQTRNQKIWLSTEFAEFNFNLFP